MSGTSERPYQACVRCIMDTRADPSILFDASGVCNHCQRYDELLSTRVIAGEPGKKALGRLVEAMKAAERESRGRCKS